MEKQIVSSIKKLYGWSDKAEITLLGNGLINHTWKVEDVSGSFVLQRINTNIFKHPNWIDDNITLLGNYLAVNNPSYLFTYPIKTINNSTLIEMDGCYYRSFNYINNVYTIDVVETPQQAYEAAFQFGKFTAVLNEFNAEKLHITLPNFHHLALRFNQLTEAMSNGNLARITAVKEDIAFLQSQKNIVKQWELFIAHPDAKKRVTHHDTKISNVLFDNNSKGVCIIDLDTIMPGYFISDVGDMMRTYLCPVSEEESNLNNIEVRKEFLKAIYDGYTRSMEFVLTNFELDNFFLSGEVLIYMQALRFLTDYINNDVYYGKKYEEHNLVRARNQIKLLQLYQAII